VLVLEKILMHRPEVALSASRFGRLRRCASMRVDLTQREMPEDKTQVIWILTLQRVDAVARHARVRAFVVTVLEQGHLGVNRALDVVI